MTSVEREVRRKMRQNELYKDFGAGLENLEEARILGKESAREYNLLPLRDHGQRQEVLERLFGSIGKDVWVEPPIYVAYGKHIHVGNSVYFNSGTTLVDDSEVIIGDEVMLGPNVTITTAGHPLHPELGRAGEDRWVFNQERRIDPAARNDS
ncbi:hypothetical protein FYJ24_04505 [Actinomycetaceae bacterium WB03_NA08]|uniref:Acetyltransferase n=1 Tax=Scrofimicrobium canadense TaxID=2652290 RepID=A0A6N7VQM7_9ACTO|nr:maltose acetyltransferase domain-containing protein [Scrofimicrobium canadense]MSS84037.1 hypothetical protein [Scrofimicrobium canadense]